VLSQRLAEVISQLKKEGLSVIISESDCRFAQMLDVVFASTAERSARRLTPSLPQRGLPCDHEIGATSSPAGKRSNEDQSCRIDTIGAKMPYAESGHWPSTPRSEGGPWRSAGEDRRRRLCHSDLS